MSAFEMNLGTASSDWTRWGGPGSGLTGKSDMVTACAMASLRVDLTALANADDDDEDNEQDPACKAETAARLKAWSDIKKYATPSGQATNKLLGPANANLESYDRAVRESMIAEEIGSALAVRATQSAVVAAVAGKTLISLGRPDAAVSKQAEIVLQRAKNRNVALGKGGRPVLHLHQLVAQHLDPLQPYADVLGISFDTHPRTVELISSACGALGPKIFRLKDLLAIKRPHRQQPGVVPMLDVPGHLSYPGGHAARAFLATTLLSSLSKNQVTNDVLWKLAAIVSNNRIKAGLHYPMDTVAGAALGIQIARWLVATTTASTVLSLSVQSKIGSNSKPSYEVKKSTSFGASQLPIWHQMFLAATSEWK